MQAGTTPWAANPGHPIFALPCPTRTATADGSSARLSACRSASGWGPPRAKRRSWPPHHLPDGTFQNPPGSPERGGGFGEWLGFFWRRLVAGDPPVAVPEGHVLPADAVAEGLARLEASEGSCGSATPAS